MNIVKNLYSDDNYCKSYKYILLDKNTELGYLNITINFIKNKSIITDFYCVKTNNGYGSILLSYVIDEMKKLKIKSISLDDMTKRYRETHNIYLKYNFKYLHESGPEMKLIFNH